MGSYIDFLRNTVSGQRLALRFHILLACGVIVLGLFAIVIAHLPVARPILDDSKWLITMGGTFFSSLSGVPLREFFKRKERIAAMEFLLGEFEALKAGGANVNGPDAEQIQQRFWKLVDSSLGA